MDYTASALVASVRRRAFMPTAGAPSSSDILATLNEEMQGFLMPMLVGMEEEYLVAVVDTTTASGTGGYDIPSNSVGGRVRDVQVPTSDANVFQSIPRVAPESAPAIATGSGYAQAYYVEANKIVLLPEPQSAYTLRLKYYRRPDQVVASGYSPFTAGTGTTTYTATVTSTTGMSSGYFSLFDSTTYEIIIEDLAGVVTNATTLTLTITADQASTLDDYKNTGVSFINAGNIPCPVPQIPQECVPLLEQRTAAMLLQQKADPRMDQAFRECEKAELRMRELLAPRTKGLPQKFVARYGPGWRRLAGIWGY